MLKKFKYSHYSILLLILLLLTPIITVVLFLFQPSTEVWQHLLETVLWDYVSNSLLLTFGVSLLSVILGVGTAWLTSNYNFPSSKLLPLALMLPLAMPAYIIAFTYTGLLDSGGIIQHHLREATGLSYGEYWFPDIRNLTGAIIMLSFVLYPYVFLTARVSFMSQSAHALEVGQSMGLTNMQRFTRIALPLARPAIVAGTALVMMETLADYGTVQYFGVNTFTTGIFRTWYGLDDINAAINLAAMLLALVFLVIGIEWFLRRQKRYTNTTKSQSVLTKITPSKSTQLVMVMFCWLPVCIGFIFPVLQLSIWALSDLSSIDAAFLTLCWNSFKLAAITAVIAVSLAFMIYAFQRFNPSKLLSQGFRLVGLGYATPGIVIAIAVLLPAGKLDDIINKVTMSLVSKEVGLVVSGTILILIFAYLVRFMAVALGNIESGFGKIGTQIDEVARSLQATPMNVTKSIHFPLMLKVLLTAMMIIFVDVLKELPTTLVLRPFNFNTLAVKAFELASDEFLVEAALPSIFIVLTGILPVIIMNYGISKHTNNK